MKMGSNYLAILGVTTVTTVMSCSPAKKEYASFELYPVRTGSLTEMEYTPLATRFYLWSPTAEEVRLMLYDAGEGGHAYETVKMEPTAARSPSTSVDENLLGKFYAFNVKINDKWQGDTPGINAHAVGVNGKRAAIIDWKTTNPEGWESDRRPSLKSPADMIIYEMHHRDFSVDSTSGIKSKGKYLALTEHGTMNSDKLLTGIHHLIELGVTHVHLLPSYDEYLLGYKDRTDVLPKEHYSKAFTNNGLFYPIVLHEGQVIGNWDKSVKKRGSLIEHSWFRLDDCVDEGALDREKDKYIRFWR